MDLDSVDAVTFGKSLKGVGLNMLVRDVAVTLAFLRAVFPVTVHQPTADFAIVSHGDDLFQLHADHTYHSNPLPSLAPELGPRGGGVELRLYEADPDLAEANARAHGFTVLRECQDRPHGLRECYILDPDGYCWVPSRASG